MRVRTTSRSAASSSLSAIPATLNARIAWLKTSGSQDPSGHTGPVPDTSTRSPARTAREKPIGPSNGESEVARRRSSAIGVPPVLRRPLGLDVDVLGELDRLVERAHRHDRRDRAERLLAQQLGTAVASGHRFLWRKGMTVLRKRLLPGADVSGSRCELTPAAF